jgi:anti-sigma factor RsiW
MTAMTRPSTRCHALFLELSRDLDGELTPARRRRIERHIKTCACCGTMSECLRKTVAACRGEGQQPLPREVIARARARIRLLIAAT